MGWAGPADQDVWSRPARAGRAGRSRTIGLCRAAPDFLAALDSAGAPDCAGPRLAAGPGCRTALDCAVSSHAGLPDCVGPRRADGMSGCRAVPSRRER
jgi:hypothetical protein